MIAMSKCRDLEPLLAAYVDGEVPAAQRATVDAHIGRCPPCRERLAGEQTAHDVLRARRDGLKACASDTLRERCTAHRQAARFGRVMTRQTWIPLSLAATVFLAVAGVFVFGVNSSVEALATQLTLDHVKCFRLGPGKVTAAPAEAGRLWASTQGWELTVPASSDPQQLQFICVRRCFVTEGRAAHLMYRWRGEPLSVYVLPSEGHRSLTQDVVERFGHEAVLWTDRGRTYVVLARGRPDDLDSVVRYVRANVR